MHLVLIEDDEKIGAFISRGLEQEGHRVDWVKNGNDGLAFGRSTGYDAAMDRMLPSRGGIEVIRCLRAEKITTPIIVLSAKSAVDDRIAGLEAGADDYLTKPFSFAELVARLQALLRRASSATTVTTHLHYAELSLDLLARRATRAGHAIDLLAKEFSLLEYLLRSPAQ